MKLRSTTAPPGRPRAFDPEQALERALHVFWKSGYEGASLTDLTEAMGINRPSLYAAFGNKEALFRRVLDRYSERWGAFTLEALAQPTARKVAERLLNAAAENLGDPKRPRGCLVVQSALACGAEAHPIRQELSACRVAGIAALRKRFERAKTAGDLPAGVEPGDLARYLTVVTNGMAVQAVNGATRAELQRVANLALSTWPTAKRRSAGGGT